MSGQRYTPVPGFGGASERHSGYGQYSGQTHPDSDDYYHGDVSAANRLSQTSNPFASRPGSQDMAYSRNSSYATHGSANQEKDLPLLSGIAAGTGLGAGAAYSNPYAGPEMREMPRSGSGSLAYQNVPSESYWPTPAGGAAPFTPERRSRKKWWIIGGVLLGVAAIAAIVAGVVVSQQKNKGGSSSSSASSSGNNAVLSNPNDPSVFDKDSRLHQSMWGIAYTAQGSIPPNCGATQANVTRDMQLLSQLTTRIRLYSANCNITAMVLEGIKAAKVDMKIWPAIYINSDETFNQAQAKTIEEAITTYGTDHIEGITVGNEYILNTAGTNSLTSSAYLASVSKIHSEIKQLNATIQSMKLSKHLPIGTSDAGSVMSTTLGAGIDYFMANVHPYFGGLAIADAAKWTWDFFQEFDVAPAQASANKPAVYIAEVGWPSQSMNASAANSGAGSPQGDASVANLQTFLDTYVCQANANGTHYFYFEAFDEPWKAQYGGVEPYWGLFDKDRNLKNITIPTC